jgi:hypothetical protein
MIENVKIYANTYTFAVFFRVAIVLYMGKGNNKMSFDSRTDSDRDAMER